MKRRILFCIGMALALPGCVSLDGFGVSYDASAKTWDIRATAKSAGKEPVALE